MAFAVLTTNTNLNATMEDLWTDPAGTHSFTFAPGAEEDFFVDDDDGVFDDYPANDTNQVVAPASTIFTDNAEVASRHNFTVTPDNGDPSFVVYVVYETATTSDDFSPMNTLNYALVSPTPLIAGVNYSISAQGPDGTVNYSEFSNITVCFAQGTRIETGAGPVAVEDLAQGDLVRTLDHGLQPILLLCKTSHRWSREPDPNKPVQFRQGCLGAGLPVRDLVVSPQHRMLIPGADGDLLAPSKGMIGLAGVRQMAGCRRVDYYHVMLGWHAVLFAEGAPSESFYPGPWVMQNLSKAQRREVEAHLTRWPRVDGTGAYAGARRFATVRQTRELLEPRRPCWSRDDLVTTLEGSRPALADASGTGAETRAQPLQARTPPSASLH